MESYHSAQIKPPPIESMNLPKVWKPPDRGGIKVNVDVAIPNGSDYVRVGLVARNEHGVTIWWARKEMSGRPPPSDG